jgi:hypothetical protein
VCGGWYEEAGSGVIAEQASPTRAVVRSSNPMRMDSHA